MDIDVNLARRLIAAQFPQWAELPIVLVEPNGWDNRTFRLGQEMSLRLPSAEGYAPQVEKEHYWLPRLAPFVSVPIPMPVALGAPASGYPWHWSVYRWLEGERATIDRIADLGQFAAQLAEFLLELQRADVTDGPEPGPHNFFRGGSLAIYDGETRSAIAELHVHIDTDSAIMAWEEALEAAWVGAPVWVHGDICADNLLVRDGRLSAVIDFGCSGVGDPACDLTIAWTLFSGESRAAFREALSTDEATWARARGWALWKALIILAREKDTNRPEAAEARRVIEEILSE